MWALVAISLMGASPSAELQTLAGDKIRGTLTSVTADALTVQTKDGPQTVSTEKLLAVVPVEKAAAGTVKPTVWIELVDGSKLIGTSYSVTKRDAAVTLLGDRKLTIPTRSIATVRFREQTDVLAEQWNKITASIKDAGADIIVVRRTATSLDQLEGVVKEINEKTVNFELDGDPIPVGREKLDGLVYYHAAGRTLPDAVCQLIDVHESQWNLKQIELADGDLLKGVSTSGVKFQIPFAELNKIDFSSGNLVFLSDLTPQSTEWTPYLPSPVAMDLLKKLYAPRRDRSFDGEKLIVGGQSFDKGLAIHSRTEIVYRLTDEYQQFIALAGIDSRVGELGHVELIIWGDNKQLFRRIITGKGEPIPIQLDIRGVRRIKILVDYGEDLDFADHLNLCKARITK